MRLRIDVHTHDIESGSSVTHARPTCATEQIEEPRLATGTDRKSAGI
jgi:hypothetical protein